MARKLIIVGVDPSSQEKGHGVAIYVDGKLEELLMLTTVRLVKEVVEVYKPDNILFSIENVLANNRIWNKNKQSSTIGKERSGQFLGMCQVSQREVMSWLDYHCIKYFLHRPSKGDWKHVSREPLFRSVTGWTGRSNKDTRSAAYFGYLQVMKQ